MRTFNGQHIGVAGFALITSLVKPSSRFTLLSSFWVLDWNLIVIVVNAIQTGSFVVGFAMMIPCEQLDRGGKPVKEHDLFDITFDINIIQPFISNFSLNMVDIEKIVSA